MELQRTFTPHGAPIRDAKLLPVQPPAQIIGRNRELGSLHVTLKIGSSVFLSGASGIGKTALASVLATAYIAANSGGVLWFNVIEDDFDLLVARAGRAYGVNALTTGEMPAVGSDEPPDTVKIIRALLAKNRPLIVLDGLVDPDAAREFIRQCATGIPVILANELPHSGPWTPHDLQPLSAEDSQKLFRLCSGLEDAMFTADIEGICKFLGGNPLAIELAGREVVADDLMPAELLTTLPSSTGRDEQLMMVSVVFKRLPSSVQAMLLVLSAMFTGSATAELISDLSDVPAVSIIPLMRQLVSRGLARESIVYGQFAYTLHEVAQSYTRSWLQQYQRLQSTENRALQAVVKYVERHAQNTTLHHDRLAAEMENVLGAAAYATSTGQAGAIRRLIQALNQKAGDFISQRGFHPEMNQLRKLATLLSPAAADATQVVSMVKPDQATQPVRPVAETQAAPPAPASKRDVGETEAVKPGTGPLGAEITQPTRVNEPPPDTQATPIIKRLPPHQESTLPPSPPSVLPLENQEDTQATQITPPKPFPAVEETQPAAEESHTPTPLERETDRSVIPEPEKSPDDTDIPTERSLPTLQKQLEDAQSQGDKADQARILHTMGQYYADTGDRVEALNYDGQALELYESLDDTDGMLVVLDELAAITAQADDAERALVYATRGVNLAQRLGDRARLGRLQTRLGDVRLALGDLPTAIETYSQAAETLRTTEDWLSIGVVMTKLGNAYLEQHKPKEAVMMLEQAIVIFQKEQRNDYVGRALGSIGAAHAELQQWKQSQEFYEKALVLAQQHRDQPSEANALSALGRARKQQGDRAGALGYYRQALHLAYQLEDVDLQAEAAFELGNILSDDMTMLATALQLLRESDSLVPNADVRRMVDRIGKRLERATAAGVQVPPPAKSSRDYAAEAYRS